MIDSAKALLLYYFPTTFFANAAAALQSASLGRPLCMRPKDRQTPLIILFGTLFDMKSFYILKLHIK